MRKLVLLTAVTVLMGSGAAAAIKALTSANSTAPQPTMSIDEIRRQVDVKSLPVLEVEEPF